MNKQNEKVKRQRKLFIVLPLLALPFITMIFWALGGGNPQKVEAQPSQIAGFNSNLPDANLKEDKAMDKLSYYDLAQADSMKFKELIQNDPNYSSAMFSDTVEEEIFDQSLSGSGLNTSSDRSSTPSNEQKIYQKLAELDKELNKPQQAMSESEDYTSYKRSPASAAVDNPEVERLEQMMDMMNQSNSEDPELKQLNGMLEKILDIQHPDRVKEKTRQASELKKDQVFAVSTSSTEIPVSLLHELPQSDIQQNGFYSLNDPAPSNQSPNAIQAIVYETQTVVDGSTVKLMLENDVFINGELIPKNSFLYGEAKLNGERLVIKIKGLRHHNNLFPVQLSVFDMDGMDGIYIPGAISRDVAKQSAERSVQSFGLTSLDPSLGAQAASAGIEAARSLIGKKVKLVKVTIKAGYRILLRDEKQAN